MSLPQYRPQICGILHLATVDKHMSVALWYYTSLIEDTETFHVVPVVQLRQNVAQKDVKVLPRTSLALSTEADDELATSRSFYELAASIAADVEQAPVKHIKTKIDEIEQVEVAATAVESVADVGEVARDVKEEVVISSAASIAHNDVNHEPVAGKEEMPSALDVKARDKTENEMIDVVAESRKLVPRMTSIPDGTEEIVTKSEEADHVKEQVNVAIADTTDEDVEASEMAATDETKPALDDESETETQSEVSEAPAIETLDTPSAAKLNEEPDSEIEETMVIDPDVIAKEAATTRTSSFACIPDQLRNNSYAVSSVAVAVVTVIAATLMARR